VILSPGNKDGIIYPCFFEGVMDRVKSKWNLSKYNIYVRQAMFERGYIGVTLFAVRWLVFTPQVIHLFACKQYYKFVENLLQT